MIDLFEIDEKKKPTTKQKIKRGSVKFLVWFLFNLKKIILSIFLVYLFTKLLELFKII